MMTFGKQGTGGSGSLMWRRSSVHMSLVCLVMGLLLSVPSFARDAAFVDPNSATGGVDDAIRVEPKNDIDVGDSPLNVARHADVFFNNQSGTPIKVQKVAVNGDGNVATEIVSDDCSKQGTIQPNNRCSVEVSLTPSSPGNWTAEVLLTHDGAGRLARAHLTGKTAGVTSTEKKDMGLSLNTKEIAPVNFGDVDTDSGTRDKIVRSALMVNDSNEPITIYSIDVIEASNGLQKLDQGCAIDMELKPGESCPVTLVWSPTDPGQISTDLIIRHSGRLGFAVIPIRGTAKGTVKDKENKSGSESASDDLPVIGHRIPSPPGAAELERTAGESIPPMSDKELHESKETRDSASGSVVAFPKLSLIGTVGVRAIILKGDGKTVLVNAGDDFDVGKNGTAKVVLVGAKSADVMFEGRKKTLELDASPELIEKAMLKVRDKKDKDKDSLGDSETSSSGGSTGSGSGSGSKSGSSTTNMSGVSGGGVIGGPAGSGTPK